MKTPLAIKLESIIPNNNATLTKDEADIIREAALEARAFIMVMAKVDKDGKIKDERAQVALDKLAQII